MASAAASQTSPPSAAAPRRLWGSDLLLRKVPLYAQARRYAAVDPDDPRSEGNTLGYGCSSYPLLAAVRACYEKVNGDDTAAEAAAATTVVDRSPFCGIDRAGYAHVPAHRKWGTAAASLAGDAVHATSEQSATMVRRAAAAVVMDDALGPATLAQVLEPWFGVLEDRLSVDAQQALRESLERAQGRKATERERAAKGGDSDATATGPREGGGDAVDEGGRADDVDTPRVLRRRRLYEREEETHGAVHTRVESAIAHLAAATPQEKEMLRSARMATNDAAAEAHAAHDGGGTALSPSPDTWGSRMLSLVTSTTAAAASGIGAAAHRSDEEAERQQKVLAYLKRVRWVTTQWSSTTNQMALKDAAASSPSWGAMTEGQRVRVEMEHTQAQRRRFRRPRRGEADKAGGDGDEADASVED
ncbi:hypothetical protein NESM_000283300 [Novymonas esmeraldas]|uniref:Uncharacterized protein n=1 Tax=Novymonas esmeraldas TaxID=1808958 RepID=A0AAW0F985_9TRYP